MTLDQYEALATNLVDARIVALWHLLTPAQRAAAQPLMHWPWPKCQIRGPHTAAECGQKW